MQFQRSSASRSRFGNQQTQMDADLCCGSFYRSGRDPFTPHHLQEGKKYDPEIQKKGAMIQVVLVKIHLDRNGKFIPSVDLRPPGQPGSQ